MALFLSAVGLVGYGVYTQIESARKKSEAAREAELARRLGQTIKVHAARNVNRAEGAKMGRGPLQIEQAIVALPESQDERVQRNLGGVGLGVKH